MPITSEESDKYPESRIQPLSQFSACVLPAQTQLSALTWRHEQISIQRFEKCSLLFVAQIAEAQQERVDFHFIELFHVPLPTLIARAQAKQDAPSSLAPETISAIGRSAIR
jgi:hypothetical protein